MTNPSADVSVRVAWADDADGIAAVQVRAWREEYAGLLPDDILVALEEEQIAQTWRGSMGLPGDARNRVLVALERNALRGYAVTVPSPDPDADGVTVGEISDLVVDPAHRRVGHGSRLLQACVDTLVADRFGHATFWLTSNDDVRRGFLTSAGWAADGAHRELDLRGDGEVLVRQVRLHTDISD